MLYKVMIVDDESIIRRGIRSSIPWAEHDMEIVAEAADGREALELAVSCKPDIVIADICMTEIDGLEMSELLLQINPDIKVIILTGYDEFEYARRAVRIGVVDYLLKPTNPEELLGILDKAKKLIQSERDQKIRMEELESKLMENMPLIRENYLIRLISGVITPKEICEGQDILNIVYANGGYQVAVLDYCSVESGSEFEGRIEMLNFAVKNLCRETVDEKGLGWTFYNERGQITILLCMRDASKNASRFVYDLMEGIQAAINKRLKASFSIGVGRRCERAVDIKRSYEEAKKALEYCFVIGENSLVFIDDVGKGVQFHSWDDLKRIEREIISCVNKGDGEMVVALIGHYFDKLTAQSGVSPVLIKAKCCELAGNIVIAFRGLGPGDEMLSDSMDDLYNEINRCNSLPKAVKLVENFICKVLEAVLASRNTGMKKLVEMGKEYIHEHFSEDISVAEIAEQLYVTPNYFSRVFKKQTGMGCLEYINQVRMEKAKELLRNSRRLAYEIAEIVGFKDANYFSIAFKKYTGFSPTEYRDRIR